MHSTQSSTQETRSPLASTGSPSTEVPQHRRYCIEAEIARGGASTIYEAVDRLMHSRIAMKALNVDLMGNPREEKRFFSEPRITALLEHPHIVPVHSIGLDDRGRPFFTMKRICGASLKTELARARDKTRTLDSLEHFLEIFLAVCDAIAYAHSRGVIHRDIKPTNILIGNFGEVYVIDWRLARIIHPERIQAPMLRTLRKLGAELDVGITLGTEQYMSPEQAYGLNDLTDERTDIFALGGVLYYILTGEAPYGDRAAAMGTLMQARQADIRPPAQIAPWACVPDEIAAIAMRALAADPDQRYPSVSALQQAVRRVLRSGLYMPRKTFGQGSLVIAEGAASDSAYLILRGTCRAFKMIDHQKVVLRQMGPGDLFGEMAVILDEPRTANVEAIDDLTVLIIPKERFDEENQAASADGWLGMVVKTLAQRFRDADRQLHGAEKVSPQATTSGTSRDLGPPHP